MEPVLAQPVRLGHLLVDRVRFHVLRKRLVERTVEVGNTSDTGQLLATCSDNLQGRKVVSV